MRKNGYVSQLQDVYEQGKIDGGRLMERRMLDYVTITLGRLGWGETRLCKFEEMINEVSHDYYELIKDDIQSKDKDFVYFRAKMDEELKRYCGGHFVPYEERYAGIITNRR